MPKPGTPKGAAPPLDRDHPHQLSTEGLKAIVRVARGKDLKAALVAGQWLVDYAERQLMQQASQASQPVLAMNASREQIIRELRGLYAKALGPQPLVVDAQAEPEPESERQVSR